ncbi:MAG: glucosyl-dolichyl phosphate glucuronosyltransferase [Ktedonobacteraceae bacterium]
MREDISVVICGYTEERYEAMVDAAESVQRQTQPPTEIVIVVDYNPQLFQRVRQRLPQVTVVENSDIKGIAGARNTGTIRAKGPLVAYLDDDALAMPDWLEQLCRLFEDPHVLGVGGRLTPLWSGKKPGWFPEEFYWVFGCSYRGMIQKEAMRIRNPIAANMAVRKSVFDASGGFRNDIGWIGARPTGCEETEFAIRARQQHPLGYFLSAPDAQVLHRVPLKRTKWTYFCTRCYSEGLSKAVVARLVGGKDGLSAERSYVSRTLPAGVLRGLVNTAVHHDLTGLARAGAIIVGLLLTVYGYVVGRGMVYAAQNTHVILRGFQAGTGAGKRVQGKN